MYLISFVLAGFLAKLRAKKFYANWHNETINDFIFYSAIGVILGGRIGHILLYSFSEFIHNPLLIFKIWLGGMSFHGGLLGVIISLILFSRKIKAPLITVLDFAAPLAPLGITLGRVGNFINSELLGRVTNMPWGMLFPGGGPLPRHPSQLYEAMVEGVLLFIIIWIYTAKPKPPGTTSGLFLCGYGVGRFICEFFRMPDQQLGFIIFDWLTMGQLLSLPMIAVGLYMFWFYTKKIPAS